MSIKKDTDISVSMSLEENTNLKIALGYARLLGWSVFPLHSIIHEKCTCNNLNCENKGKHPANINGVKDATTDTDIITKWWTDRPFLNIGIATGKKSGFFVLDIDTDLHKGTGITGFEALEDLQHEHGELPSTPYQITGSGGNHFLFKRVEGIGNKTNLFPSIDIRGDGGYIVVSPSIHESGREYAWELDHCPSMMEIAAAPQWLLDALLPKTNGKFKARPVSDYINILQEVHEGERNNALMTLIGHLKVRLDFREAFEIVHIWNESRVNPPLDKDTVTTAFNNVLRRETEKR